MTQSWYFSAPEVISQPEVNQGIEARSRVFHNGRLVSVAGHGLGVMSAKDDPIEMSFAIQKLHHERPILVIKIKPFGFQSSYRKERNLFPLSYNCTYKQASDNPINGIIHQ